MIFFPCQLSGLPLSIVDPKDSSLCSEQDLERDRGATLTSFCVLAGFPDQDLGIQMRGVSGSDLEELLFCHLLAIKYELINE